MASHPQRSTPQHAASRRMSSKTLPKAPIALPQPLSLRPASSHSQLPPFPPTFPTTTQACARAASFVTSLHADYASLSDTATPQLFYRLCREYLEGRADAAMFYASTYRLLLRTGGEGLLGELSEFVPVGWRGMGTECLEGTEDGDERMGREDKGDTTMDGRAMDPEDEEGDGDVREGRQEKRKRRPINGFRSGASPPRAGVAVLKGIENNEAMNEQDNTINKTASSSTPAQFSRTGQTSNITRPSEHSPTPTTPATSTVYPTRRAVLSRPLTKPYIHARCGQRFGHPQDVRRHHIGQGGRPGCWERNGKPDREWDEHESCKVTFGDLVAKKVEGGFAVLDWGAAEAPEVKEDGKAEDPEVDKDEDGRGDEQMEGEGGQDVKMGNFDANAEGGGMEASEEHSAKRLKISNEVAPVMDFNFRSVALGLRARKLV